MRSEDDEPVFTSTGADGHEQPGDAGSPRGKGLRWRSHYHLPERGLPTKRDRRRSPRGSAEAVQEWAHRGATFMSCGFDGDLLLKAFGELGEQTRQLMGDRLL